MERRAKIIVTPGSGEGRATATARRLEALLRRRGWEATVQAFRDLDALARWARDTEPDFSHLVCVGGDTTLSKAARLSVRTGIPFVPVPNGFQSSCHRYRHRPVSCMMRSRIRRVTAGRKPRTLLSGAIVSLVGYLTLAILAAQQEFAAIDHGTRDWMALVRDQLPDLPFALVTHLGDRWGLLSLLAIGVLFLAWRGQRRWALALPVLMTGVGLLQWFAKRASHRSRLDLEPLGFPSGHVLSVVVFFGLMIYLIATASKRRRRWRVLACLVCTAAVVVVAFSRLYLDRHWLSDVIGGFSVGVAYLLVAIWVVEVVWTHPEAGTGAPSRRPDDEAGRTPDIDRSEARG